MLIDYWINFFKLDTYFMIIQKYMSVNLQWLVDSTPSVSSYTPIFEFVVNSIQSIEERGIEDWNIDIEIIRHHAKQAGLTHDEIEDWTILGFIIRDNWIGFTDKNTNAFDELFTDNKKNKWCIWYWRCTALKVFRDVMIESVYECTDKTRKRRTFSFKIGWDKSEWRGIISNEIIESVPKDIPITTTIHLGSINPKFLTHFDKQTQTIGKRLVEHLLPYLINPPKYFPQINIIDGNTTENLNNFISTSNEIEKYELDSNDFNIKKWDFESNFHINIILFHGTQEQSSKIVLTAHNRSVTKTALQKYIPEFSTWIQEKREWKATRTFFIKIYISSEYLDQTVNFHRQWFEFWWSWWMFNSINQEDIELQASDIVKKLFQEVYSERSEKKADSIRKVVREEMPWFDGLLKHIDFKKLPYEADSKALAMELHQLQFEHEQNIKKKLNKYLDNPIENQEEIDKIFVEVKDLKKDQLAHYMSMRKYAIIRLEKLLSIIHTTQRYVTEDEMHNLIFPMQKDSDEVTYDEHNLWLLDERLTFNTYVSSDKWIFNNSWDRVDLAIFWNQTLFRETNEESTPAFIYELKRPWEKLENKDHVAKLVDYIINIRENNLTDDIKWRKVNIGKTTPIYWYLICDLCPMIIKQAKNHSFEDLPDWQWFYKYHNIWAYIEILSWDKILKDANMRHRIFFNKLWIE